MAQAFDEAGAASGPPPDIRYANVLPVARPRQSLDLIVTIPPYDTSYEYADLHQLSSLWLGYAQHHRGLSSEENTHALQSLKRISLAVFSLNTKTTQSNMTRT